MIYLLELTDNGYVDMHVACCKKVVCAKSEKEARQLAHDHSITSTRNAEWDPAENWTDKEKSICISLDPKYKGVISMEYI